MIRRAGFGHLVSVTDHGLESTGLPMLVDDSGGDSLVLRAHFARANPHWKSVDGVDALMIFALTDGYVSPAWYPSKAEDPRVVPTWNYEVVHVHGRVAVRDDPAWKLALVSALTDRHERRRPHDVDAPIWAVDDAPVDFIDKQLGAIVGVEMTVDRIEAKSKLSQNRSIEDREGVIEGLSERLLDDEVPLAAAMRKAMPMSPPSPALAAALAEIDRKFAGFRAERD